MVRCPQRKISIALVLLIAGAGWICYATVRQARLNETLVQSIRAGRASVALNVLQKGADPNARDYGKTDTSLWQRMKKRFQPLFTRGALPKQEQYPSALALAVERKDSDVVSILLAHGATGVNEQVNFRRPDLPEMPSVRLSLLSGAAQNGDLEIVKALLDHGANVNTTDAEGNTALMLCLDAAPSPSVDENKETRDDTESMRKNYDEVASLLVQRGIDVRHKRKEDGATAISYAAKNDLPDVVDLLLARGADPNPISDQQDMAPVCWAARNNDILMLRSLLKKGATVKPPNENTPPMVEATSVQALRLLLDWGADPNAQQIFSRASGTTALMWAASRNDMASVRLLLSRGADVNVSSGIGSTPLMWATSAGHDVIHTLLKHGARVNVRDRDGKTALMFAAENGNDVAVLTLINAGAKVNLCAENGGTALDVARKANNIDRNHTHTILLLRKHGAK